MAEIDLDEGHHSLSVEKRTWYDTPLSYLNILNPFFYVWTGILSSRGKEFSPIGYDENFAAIKIFFDVVDEQNAAIELSLERIEQIDPLGYFY